MTDAADNAVFKVGDHVCVHGKGFGRIVRIIERDVTPYAVVSIPRREYHEASGRRIEWTERVNVSLNVYPPHMTRNAA